MRMLLDASLQDDIDKCEVEAKTVKYLGFIEEACKGIRVDPGKIRAVEAWQTPKSVRRVRGFLGFC